MERTSPQSSALRMRYKLLFALAYSVIVAALLFAHPFQEQAHGVDTLSQNHTILP